MNKRIIVVVFALLGLLVFIVGVPIIINESYKAGGYITLWQAEDVLSYYGTILGAAVSVIVLAATILFTRKQIFHDQFVKTQSEKWRNADTIIRQTVDTIQPLRITQIVYADIGYEHAGETINKLHRYIMDMKMSLDMLHCHLDTIEEGRLSALTQQILSCMDEVELLSGQMIHQLSCIQKNIMHDNCKKLLRLALESTDGTDEETVQSYRDYLKENPYISPDDITKEIGEIGLKLVDVYNTSYQSLLDKKREVFREIEKENTESANKMLHWFSRRGR